MTSKGDFVAIEALGLAAVDEVGSISNEATMLIVDTIFERVLLVVQGATAQALRTTPRDVVLTTGHGGGREGEAVLAKVGAALGLAPCPWLLPLADSKRGECKGARNPRTRGGITCEERRKGRRISTCKE
ncbi:hypothetical protein H5410_036685 [Solanum commersonii]|uniref:Uncharacterized protein n=1 Tax=Solanum commersonii TaxID=4109 RepID=A0A9J5Y5J8_SOLCO|nr:hypothetical protein H5410_036685 [Solanum commersonii]